jgi:diguanylate cyclase (GGDEF)-like protein
MSELLEHIMRARLFHEVPRALIDSILPARTRRALAPREMLLRAGQDNETLYVVISGAVHVHFATAERPYIRLGAGECVGELSVIDHSRVSADVIASEPSVLLSIERARFWTLIDSSAAVARNLLRILAGRVRHDDVALAQSDKLQLQYEHLATVDALTGLHNRRWLDSAFQRQMNRALREWQPVSMLMIDLDHFKRLNDHHGHLVGDAVLRRAARRIAADLRPQDLFARYGGDEFAVLLPGADQAHAVSIAERLRQAVAEGPALPDEEWSPTTSVSIGVATIEVAVPLAGLLAIADAALYRAKQAGRDRVSV